MITKEFKEAYERLNPRQKEAVDTIEGPVIVIAGPGTGKTQILALRIANILAKTDTAASSILALTFTEAAAANMRKRLVNLIGSRGYYVNISTFHGFANRVIQEYPEYFPEIAGAEPATQVEQVAILRDIIEQDSWEHLKPFGNQFFMVPKVLSAIQHLKRENFSPLEFERHLSEEEKSFAAISDLYHEKGVHQGKMKGEYRKQLEKLTKNKELARAYSRYQQLLRERKRYDFDDMILELIRALEGREELLLTLEERYQYYLVDEHQDTNGAQNRLLELLNSFYPVPNLFVVGDEKQAIYRFQGASLDNFLYFKNKYPEAKVISLESNYRSPQWLLDSAETLINKNQNTIKASLRAVEGKGANPSTLLGTSKVAVYEFQTPEGELTYLADTIMARLSAGVPAREIAVLYRENEDAYPIVEFLEKRGLAVVVESNQDVLSDPDIRKLINLFVAIVHFGEDAYLLPAMQADFIGLEPLDLYRLLGAREHYKTNLFRILSKLKKEEEFARSFELEETDKLREFYVSLVRWRKAAVNEHGLKVFEQVVRESGLLAHILKQPTHFEKMAKLTRIFEEARKASAGVADYRLNDFLRHLEILKEHNVPVRFRESYAPNSVRLMTAHSAKGLEFDCVFIVGVVDGHWGNRRGHGGFHLPYRTSVIGSEPFDRFDKLTASKLRATDTFNKLNLQSEENEDERRLFYMALTRTKKEVSVSYAMRDAEGRPQVPSQFTLEIGPDLRINFPTGEYEEKFRAGREMIFASRTGLAPRLEDREFLRDLFLRRGFSPTHLNNYLSCPWKYFYENLLRVPQVPTRPQVYGIAVHAALEKFFKSKREGQGANIETMLAEFERVVQKQSVMNADKEAIIAKGRKVLPPYCEHYQMEWNYNAETEINIRGVLLTPEIKLTGKLDKIEFTNSPGEVVVVDYKTRKPESRNAILGKTANSDGNFYRQLTFYRLLLEQNEDRPLRMRAAEIDFVEPNERGIYKKERFEIPDQDVMDLKETILRVADEILNLKFWGRRCGEKDCSWCDMREVTD